MIYISSRSVCRGKMTHVSVYHLQIRGSVDASEINVMSPVQLEQEWTNTAVTQFAVQTDQSGLLGLMRYLHNRGFIFNNIFCESVQITKTILNETVQK